MERDGCSRGGRGLFESNIRNGAGAGEDADPGVSPATESRNGFWDIFPSRDFEHVRAHGRFGFSGDDDGWFRFVLGTWRSASGTLSNFDGGAVAGLGCGGGRSGGGGAARVLFVGEVVRERVKLGEDGGLSLIHI